MVLLLGVLPVQAEQRPAPREIIVIPKTYISPGASGSVGGYQQYERHQLINGQRVPTLNSRERIQTNDSQIQQWGGMRQSTEYPGGLRIQRFPGNSSSGSQERH